MSNGNIFVNASGGQGGDGIMYETDPTGTNIVWQHNGDGPAKAFRYECEYPGIIELLNDPCDVAQLNELTDINIQIYPNPSSGMFQLSGVEEKATIRIFDAFGTLIQEIQETSFDLSHCAEGLYFISIIKGNGSIISKRIVLNK